MFISQFILSAKWKMKIEIYTSKESSDDVLLGAHDAVTSPTPDGSTSQQMMQGILLLLQHADAEASSRPHHLVAFVLPPPPPSIGQAANHWLLPSGWCHLYHFERIPAYSYNTTFLPCPFHWDHIIHVIIVIQLNYHY